MMRGAPCMDVIRPKAPELKLVCVRSAFISVGGPQLNVLSRLNVSTRSSRLRLAPNGARREIATSSVRKPGARTLLRLKLPSVPGAGSAKAAGLSQLLSGLLALGFGRVLVQPAVFISVA